MSGEAIALLLLLGASVGLASGIAGATLVVLATPLIDTSALAVLFILFALFSAWRLIATRSSPARQKAAPPNSIIIRALHGLFGGVLRQLRSGWCLGDIAQGGGDE
jgi:uncharacterized membrane protein YfcA